MTKSGCKVFLGILFSFIALAFIFSFNRGCAMPAASNTENPEGPALAKIGDVGITQEQINSLAKGPELDPLNATPGGIAAAYGRAVDTVVTQAYLEVLAKELGASTDEKAAMQAVTAMADQRSEMMKMLNPKAKPEQLEQERQQEIQGAQQALQDPQMKPLIMGQLMNQIVINALQNKMNVSDEEVKHSEDQYHTKRIFLSADKYKGQNLQALGESVLNDIKSGKLTFEQAMDKYTNDPPGKGRPPHENTMQVNGTSIKTSDEFAGIDQLKPGQMTGVLPVQGTPGGVAIYRLDSVEQKPFTGDIKQTRSQYMTGLAAKQLQDGLKRVKQSQPIKWEDPGYQLLYDWYSKTSDPQASQDYVKLPPAEQHKIDLDFVNKGTGANVDQGAILAATGAMEHLYSTSTADEKKKLEDRRVQILNQLLQSFDSYSARIELVDYYTKKKDSDAIFRNLSQAAELIAGDMSPEGQKKFGDLSAKLQELEKDKLISSANADVVQKKLDQWRKDKAMNDKQMEDQRKEQEAEMKRQAEEQKKAEKAGKAAAPAPGAKAAPNPGSSPIPPAPNGGGAPAPTGPNAPGAQPPAKATPPPAGKTTG